MKKNYICPNMKMRSMCIEQFICVSDGNRYSTWGAREDDWINEGFDGESTAGKSGVQIEGNNGTIDSRSGRFNVWDD